MCVGFQTFIMHAFSAKAIRNEHAALKSQVLLTPLYAQLNGILVKEI